MKKIIVSIMCIAVILLFAGCDSGLEIISSKIEKYPDRIVYFAKHDTALDLSGGIITLHTKEGTIFTYSMDDEEHVLVEYDIDFSKPGVYQIELPGQLFMPIQVVDTDYINMYQK